MANDPKTVLIVEDDALRSKMLAMFVTRKGHGVKVAHTADEAWKMLQEGLRPDLMVTDVDMPGKLNGITLLKALRQQEAESGKGHIPVIVQTGILHDKAVSRKDQIEALPGDNRLVDKAGSTHLLKEAFAAALGGLDNGRGSR